MLAALRDPRALSGTLVPIFFVCFFTYVFFNNLSTLTTNPVFPVPQRVLLPSVKEKGKQPVAVSIFFPSPQRAKRRVEWFALRYQCGAAILMLSFLVYRYSSLFYRNPTVSCSGSKSAGLYKRLYGSTNRNTGSPNPFPNSVFRGDHCLRDGPFFRGNVANANTSS